MFSSLLQIYHNLRFLHSGCGATVIIINDIYKAQMPKSIKCATSTVQQSVKQIQLQVLPKNVLRLVYRT